MRATPTNIDVRAKYMSWYERPHPIRDLSFQDLILLVGHESALTPNEWGLKRGHREDRVMENKT